MSVDPSIISNLPEVPPLPAIRMFKVTRPTVDFVTTTTENIEAHAVEESPTGTLMFFEHVVETTPTGFRPSSKLRRAFAKGQWADVEEINLAIRAGLMLN